MTIGIITPLGDLHNGKQTQLITENGISYIYKPRNADTERAWKAFLWALRSAGLTMLPGAVEILSEDDNGHTEGVVEHLPTTPEALPGYYRRCGVLLFFAWLFGATDLHGENLIACGDVPVPVDLETLFSGVEARTREETLRSLAWSVYRAHLLPQFDGKTDISGFTGTNAEGNNLPYVSDLPCRDGTLPSAGGVAAGSSDRTRGTDPSTPLRSAQDDKSPDAPLRRDGTLPSAYGLSPEEISEHICAGFTEAFHFAETHRELLETELRRFGGCRFRVLLRPTDVYGKLNAYLDKLPPEDRERYAQTLILPAYRRDRDPERVQKAAGAIREEVAALVRGEIPLFVVYGEGLDLYFGRELVLKDYLRLSPVDFAVSRLRELSGAELERQTALIRLSYDALRPLEPEEENQTTLSKALDTLDACAVPHHPSSFIHLAADGSGKGYFQSAGWGLYDGLAGILLAYAAVYRRTGDKRVLARLEALYEPLPKALSGGPLALTDTACSLGDGLGGILAALLHLAELTGEARFRDDALGFAARLDPSRCELKTADLLNGAGGLALQLPKLPADLARPLAEALLPVLRDAEPTLTGLAHGAAGQAMSLAALWKVLPGAELRPAILALLRWEDELFDPEAGNWPDLRNGKRTDFMGGWCSGAPGVGLARLRLLDYVRDPEIDAICREDMARAAAWLAKAPMGRRDTLCCGNAARLAAASRLGAETATFRARLSGSLRPDSPRLYHMLNTADKNPGLMQGVSGVIYALAMAGDPLCGEMLL